jgi:hypothetical protein
VTGEIYFANSLRMAMRSAGKPFEKLIGIHLRNWKASPKLSVLIPVFDPYRVASSS